MKCSTYLYIILCSYWRYVLPIWIIILNDGTSLNILIGGTGFIIFSSNTYHCPSVVRKELIILKYSTQGMPSISDCRPDHDNRSKNLWSIMITACTTNEWLARRYIPIKKKNIYFDRRCNFCINRTNFELQMDLNIYYYVVISFRISHIISVYLLGTRTKPLEFNIQYPRIHVSK